MWNETWFTVDPYNVDKWAESCMNRYVCGPQNVRESGDSYFWHSRELFSTGCLSTPKTLWISITVQTQGMVMEHWRLCVCTKCRHHTVLQAWRCDGVGKGTGNKPQEVAWSRGWIWRPTCAHVHMQTNTSPASRLVLCMPAALKVITTCLIQ